MRYNSVLFELAFIKRVSCEVFSEILSDDLRPGKQILMVLISRVMGHKSLQYHILMVDLTSFVYLDSASNVEEAKNKSD